MKIEKKLYFISDAHLGVDSCLSSEERELLLIEWLNQIKTDAGEINFLGDIFDFWFEFKYLVPRNFVRLISKIRELSDAGIIINFFTGNHDMWIFDYLPSICKMNIYKKPLIKEINGKFLYFAHGDGLGKYDRKYNVLKKFFSSKICQLLFKILHPSISFRIAMLWSKSSRKKHDYSETINYENEFLVKYATEVLKTQHIDFFIFGHRHIPFQYKIEENVLFTNTGDWLINFSYSVFDGENLILTQLANPRHV